MTDSAIRAAMDAARGRVAAYGPPTDDEMDALRDIVSGDLQPSDLFVVEMIPSSTDVDSYFTHMDPDTTLATFAQDSAEGVPIMYNHARYELPVGRTFGGQLASSPFTTPRGVVVPGSEDAPLVWSRYYLVRGMATPSGTTDDVIRGIQGGINKDVSVGFGNSPRSLRKHNLGYWYRCDECGNDLLRSNDCTHWPGQIYTESDGSTRRITATVMNAGLLETSPVWRGSNPGAHHLRALEDRVTRGVLSYADIADIDGATGQRYAATLDWAALKPKGRTYMTPEEIAAKKAADEEARRALLDEAHADETPDASTDAEGRADDAGAEHRAKDKGDESPLLALLRTHEITDEAALRRVLAEAEDGRLYRADLIDLCHRAGVRAEGAGYSREVQQRMLDVLGTADLQTVLASRNAAARERFAKDTGDGSDPATEKLRGALADRVGGRQTEVSGPLGHAANRAAPVEVKPKASSYKVGKKS